jgi:hypothetical protein
MDFSFDIAGFDFIPSAGTYGVWFLSFKFYDKNDEYDVDHRSIFCLHFTKGFIPRLEILFITLSGW